MSIKREDNLFWVDIGEFHECCNLYALPLIGKFTKISEMVNGIDPGIKIENVKSLKS